MIAKAGSPGPRANDGYDSPGRRANDARSLEDLERALRAFKVADAEWGRLHAQERRQHNEKADSDEIARATEHNTKIEQVANDREKVRHEAEAVLQRFYQKQEEERKRQEDEQRRKEEERRRQDEERRRREEEERLRLQREAEQKAERERKLAEEKERQQKAEEDRRQADQDRVAREKEQERLAEIEKKQKAEEQRKADEETKRVEDARQHAAEQEAQKVAANSPEALHQEYITLYFNIKNWSNNYWVELRDASKTHKNPSIKEEIGETRRLIKSEIGKLSSHDKEINRMASSKLKTAFGSLLQKTTPVVGKRLPINNFLPTSLHLTDNNQTTITDMAAYFLVFLTKQVIKIFTSYVHSGPERAEPIGVVLSSIFAIQEIQYARPNQPGQGPDSSQNLFPIFLAKYHRVCPALFGVTAPAGHSQSTAQGKRALGWQLAPAAEEGDPKTTFVSDQTHYDRMKGLAIGYSSIALRNFSGVTMPNPYPPKYFWKSLAMIVNLPVDKVSPTHICVLRYMFGHGGIGRFLLFFGSVGVAVLREAFIEFPKRLPEEMKKDYYVKDLMFWAENVVGDKEHLHLA